MIEIMEYEICAGRIGVSTYDNGNVRLRRFVTGLSAMFRLVVVIAKPKALKITPTAFAISGVIEINRKILSIGLDAIL